MAKAYESSAAYVTPERVKLCIDWLTRRGLPATAADIADRLGTDDVAAVEAVIAAPVAAGKIRETN